jgi:hypothetical protein
MPTLPLSQGNQSPGRLPLGRMGQGMALNRVQDTSVEDLDRAGRRMQLLRRYAPDLVTSNVEGALTLAESGVNDNELLRSAVETNNFARLRQIREGLEGEDDEVQRAMFQGMPEGITNALSDMGYKVPERKKKGRLFGSIPVLGDVTEVALDWGEVPGIGGALEEVQHVVGEGLEGVGGVAEPALSAFAWPQEQIGHFYRAWKHIGDQPGDAKPWDYFSPSEFGHAWGETHEDDYYVRPANLSRARRMLGDDRRVLRMARMLAAGRTPDQIIEDFGHDPDSPEALRLGMMFVQAQADPEFQSAVHELSIGQVSFGRTIANTFGFDDTDQGWGRIVSGTVDAGFRIASDPLLHGGGLLKDIRFGRNAYRLENMGEPLRLRNTVRAARELTEGAGRGQVRRVMANMNGPIRPGEMRRIQGLRAWAGRVSEGFRTGEFSRLTRELPNTQTAMGDMIRADVTRRHTIDPDTGEALRGLDSPEGVLEWLESAEGTKSLMSTRLGGGSPIGAGRGVQLPTLTAAQRRVLQGRTAFTQLIDMGRVQYAPAMKEFLSQVGQPRQLARHVGRFAIAHTAGDASRVIASLAAHTPYRNFIPLYGNEAIEEFQRFANTGIFAGLDRPTLDSMVDQFARGGLVERTELTRMLNEQLFEALGVNATEEGRRFASRFTDRSQQAYAVDGGDSVMIGGAITKGSRLVDAQHADSMAIPRIWSPTGDGLLNMARRTNMVRFFNNAPATHVNALLGRAWKPAVLMRIGFIPRAAGEEILRFALAHGGRTYLGAKGAEWQVRDVLSHRLEAELREAESLGQVDQINRIRQRMAESSGALAPLRELAGAAERAWSILWSTEKEGAGRWGRYWTRRAEQSLPVAQGGPGIAAGLERWADEASLWASGVMHRVAQKAHVPTKPEIGDWMARHWNPRASDAARLMIEDDTVAKAFAEHVAGSTMVPYETRRMVDSRGTAIPRIGMIDTSGGVPAVMDVQMRALTNDWQQFTRTSTGADINGYFNSVYTRQRRLRRDRVANRVIEGVLPRWVGDWGETVTSRLGAEDIGVLRGELNQLWEGDDGEQLLNTARRIVDRDPDVGEGLKVNFGKAIDDRAHELGLTIDGRKLRTALEDDTVPGAGQRWLIYQDVNPDRLLDDWADLEHAAINSARGRLARPDMQPHLREMRLYAGDERLAQPAPDGISKVYVPLVEADPGVVDEQFISAISRRIFHIGGYSEQQAEDIARRVAGGLDDAREAADWSPGIQRALSAWGTSDPRIADAVMAATDEVLGTTSTFGILSVPDEVMQRAASVQPLGVRTQAEHWEIADDYNIDPYHLPHVKATPQNRRLVSLRVGPRGQADWFDEVELGQATAAYGTQRTGTTRLYSTDRETWDTDVPEGPFWFVDAPPDAGPMTNELAQDLGARRLPAMPPEDGNWSPMVRRREVGEGLGEIEAMERVADSSMDEIFEVLTTLKRADLDDDVIHEVVEPLLRPDRKYLDPAGNAIVEPGYGYNHLVMGTSWDRLPQETYGPRIVAAPDLKWDRIVREWFDGPVDKALSSIIRKPMFLHNFGEQLAQQRNLTRLFVDDDAEIPMRNLGLDDDQLDHLALGLRHGDSDEEIIDLLGDYVDPDTISNVDLQNVRFWSSQRNHALDTIRSNALNRAVELTTPYIDDHRIRSAFQNYVNNLIPFQFAEEQFLKRWVRTVWESPETIRKMQLSMNGMRNMGVVRKDERGQDVFVYPLVGEAVAAVSHLVAPIFGENLRIPYTAAMTGAVGYTLPGLGERLGTPSVGPLVAMPLELLSRHHPELADVEALVSGPGADRPVWQYFTPSWAGRAWESMFGDVDKGQLGSATVQAMQMMAVNGQAPPEDASPDQMQEFIDRATGQARTILMARSLLGMVGPAAPQWNTEADQLNARFVELLRTSGDTDTAVRALLKENPDIEPHDLLSVTAFTTESEYAGLGTPTDETFDWINENNSLVEGFPAAAPWIIPRAGADDQFSYRAWAQQVAKGLRRRKAPKEFLEDMYFQMASRDYFEAREAHEADLLTAVGNDRQELEGQWREWKQAYYAQHPVFANALEDPERSQRRRQAVDELNTLAADEEGPVPDDLREMLGRYREYSMTIEALRGSRTSAVTEHRKDLTTEFVTWGAWYLHKFPHLRGFWMRIIEPELAFLDEDAQSALSSI